MTAPSIGVTGSTGRLGRRVADRLAAAGLSQRLIVRDLTKAPNVPGAAVAQAAYDEAKALPEALDGLTTVFMVSATEAPNRIEQHRTFIDAAATAGVEQLIYTSLFHAAPAGTFTFARDHYATEQHVRAAGVGFTFLRDNFYADFMPALVGPDDVIRGPGGDGRLAPVAIDDIAEAAAAVLLDPSAHRGTTYELSGPESLSLEEVAAILTTELARPISYHSETVEEAYASRARYEAPAWQVESWVSTYTAIANGEFADVTSDLARLIGRPSTSLGQLLRRSTAAR
jgi:NAD(P)H dehydrogenase (quinone)